MEERYAKMRKGARQKTGGLITADGSEDSLIAPQGLDSWPGPHPPSFTIPVEWGPAQPQVAEGEEAQEEEVEEEDSDTDKLTSSSEDSDEDSDE